MYKKTPSEMLKISDNYIAYCLDEAIAEFIILIEKGKEPRFKRSKEETKNNPGYNPGLNMLVGKK
ncbi:hypothetical protein H7E68_16330 [Clostridium gasigenes]|uniref:Uncharacterized protein n=2 Tax=Clostridium gasigenes TaxID=94869 RepID=A0A7X0SH62_9CLOT|nr:hypothetical protein [Clostridium gasigenes]